jgi:hypothetical protein
LITAKTDEELARIAARLEGSGALALLVIEAAEPLERIEKRYGTEAYDRAMKGLVNLARERARSFRPAICSSPSSMARTRSSSTSSDPAATTTSTEPSCAT